jgi:hypothetical protein
VALAVRYTSLGDVIEPGGVHLRTVNPMFPVVVLVALITASCSSDPTGSGEYRDLEQQLAAVQQDRDDLAAVIAATEARYERSEAAQKATTEIIANPEAFGSEDEVLDLLMAYATEDAVMDDVAFGAVPMREAWYRTIYESEAEIVTWHRWLSDDGSNGGSLWSWRGFSHSSGEKFDLIGLSIISYNDDGQQTYQLVVWPYPDEYVVSSVLG